MPTVLRVGAYRFFFYAGDRNKPSHVHVERDEKIAKFWLEPVRLQRSGGFNRVDIKQIQSIVVENQEQLREVWHEYFRNA
ncbi:MAG: hypothetical protein NPIRA02_36340 [Nitrospirales bacterium]|nr:MAG: hypothetical protein NPIRA02_36340 [Nitrospirales bacterium]